jgi:hypothetical protein
LRNALIDLADKLTHIADRVDPEERKKREIKLIDNGKSGPLMSALQAAYHHVCIVDAFGSKAVWLVKSKCYVLCREYCRLKSDDCPHQKIIAVEI